MSYENYLDKCIKTALRERDAELSALAKERGAAAEREVNENEQIQAFERIEELINAANTKSSWLRAFVVYMRGDFGEVSKTFFENLADFMEKNNGMFWKFIFNKYGKIITNKSLAHFAKLEWAGLCSAKNACKDEFSERNLAAIKKIEQLAED